MTLTAKQQRFTVEEYLRTEASFWRGLEKVSALRTVAIDLPLVEIYSGLPFDAEPTNNMHDGEKHGSR